MFICFRQRAKNLQAPNDNKANISTVTTTKMPQDLVKAKDIYVRVYVFRCVDKTFGIYETRAQHQPKQQAANKVL